MRALLIFLICRQVVCASFGFAYLDDYPPYLFKEGAPSRFALEDLFAETAANGSGYYKEGALEIELSETADTQRAYRFLIKDGGQILMKVEGFDQPALPSSVYRADLDNNGLDDLMVISWSRGVGLAVLLGSVDIFMKKAPESYDHIHYESVAAGPEDFVDMDQDGRAEVIMPSYYMGNKHNYFAYAVYEIAGGRLVNVSSRYKGFPKFIWYTHKPNDKQTTHLTKAEKAGHIREIESKIKYRHILLESGLSGAEGN